MEGLISSTTGKHIEVKVTIRPLTPQERKRLALRTIGTFWLLALVTAPLPPIHWLTVPGFFLFGIYLAFRKLRETNYLEEFRFPCPECGREVHRSLQLLRNPSDFVCPHCRYGLKMTLTGA